MSKSNTANVPPVIPCWHHKMFHLGVIVTTLVACCRHSDVMALSHYKHWISAWRQTLLRNIYGTLWLTVAWYWELVEAKSLYSKAWWCLWYMPCTGVTRPLVARVVLIFTKGQLNPGRHEKLGTEAGLVPFWNLGFAKLRNRKFVPHFSIL